MATWRALLFFLFRKCVLECHVTCLFLMWALWFYVFCKVCLTLSSLWVLAKKNHKVHFPSLLLPQGHRCDLYTHSKAHGLGLYWPHYTQEMLSLDYRVSYLLFRSNPNFFRFCYHGTLGVSVGSPKGSTSTYLTSYWILVGLCFEQQ